MVKNQEKQNNKVEIQTQGLPFMSLKITKLIGDIETANIELSCGGYDFDHCKFGMEFLISQANNLDKKPQEDKKQ